MSVPDAVGEVVGYRVFRPLPSGLLGPYNSGFGKWMPGVNEAVCFGDSEPKRVRRNGPDGTLIDDIYEPHAPIPDPDCNCGFWLLPTVEALVTRFLRGGMYHPSTSSGTSLHLYTTMLAMWPDTHPSNFVVAEVRGWGRTLVGETGHRTEFAQVTKLLTGNRANVITDLDAIAEKFGIPVEEHPDLMVEEPTPLERKRAREHGWTRLADWKWLPNP